MLPRTNRVSLLLFSLISIFICSLHTTAHSQKSTNVLTILTWSDYLDPDVVKQFEEKYQTEIKFVYFEEDDERDAIMVDSDGLGYDIILISGIRVDLYKKKGWITSINEEDVPNLKNIRKNWLKAFNGTEGYTVPYFWGTLGIAYRADLVKEKITSWKQLYQPDQSLKGKIFMLSSQRDLIGSAMKSLGYSINSTTKKEINDVKELLIEQKPFVNHYGYIMVDANSSLVTGKDWVAMAFNGDAIMLQEHNENIQYVLPEEGTNIWVDYFTISSKASNQKLAHQFLNYLNEPKIAAQNSLFVYFATPNIEAEKLLPQNFINHPVIYPSQEILAKSEFYKPLPPSTIKHMNSIVSDLKSN